jgi:hypothetical protein
VSSIDKWTIILCIVAIAAIVGLLLPALTAIR